MLDVGEDELLMLLLVMAAELDQAHHVGIGARREQCGDRIVVDEILLGRGSLLKRLRGPDARARGIRWESVTEVGERIVVRA